MHPAVARGNLISFSAAFMALASQPAQAQGYLDLHDYSVYVGTLANRLHGRGAR